MTDNALQLVRGDEYAVFYRGGPFDGSTDRRISTDGSWDEELTVIASVDGKETQLRYVNPVAKRMGEQVQVTYAWDEADSEPLEDLDDRNEH